jgi:hypothetical protein
LDISPEAIDRFDQLLPTANVMKSGTKVLIGTPAAYPNELTAAVTAYLKTRKTVKSAWLVLMNKEGEFSFLIVTDSTGDRDEISYGIGKAARPHLRKGEILDVMLREPGISENVAKGYKPFYKRKKLGIF